MNVTLPNGKVIQNVPDGTSKQEIMDKAIAAGLAAREDFPQDTQRTQQERRLSNISSMQQRGDEREEAERLKAAEIEGLPEIGTHPMLSTLSGDALSREGLNLAIGFLSAPDDEFAAIIQKNLPNAKVRQTELGNYIVDTPEGSYSLNKPGISTRDIESLLFRFGAAIPAGRTAATGIKGLTQVAGQEALTEGALQAAEASAGGEFSPEDVITAGALGGASQGLGEVISSIGRGASGEIPEYAQEVIDIGREADIPVTTSDLVDPTRASKLAAQTGELVPIVGTGGIRKVQQQGRENIVNSIVGEYAPVTADDVYQSLVRQTDKVKKAAGTSRQKIVDKVGDIGSELDNTLTAIDDELQRLQYLPNGQPRKTVDSQTVETLKAYRDDLAADPTFRGVADLRTSFRENVKGDRQSIVSGSEAAINRIYGAMTKDLDSVVKDNLSPNELRQWKQSNAIYAQEMNKIKKSRLKSILDKGDVTPERVTALLSSKKPSEVVSLYKSLDNQGRAAARASIIHKAANAARESDGSINPTGFANALKKDKIATDIFFKGKEKRAIDGLNKLLSATKRAQDFTATPPTGQQLVGAGAVAGLTIDPSLFGGALSAGALARIYESPQSRDFLLRLANTPVKSTKFDNILREGLPAFNALIQSSTEAYQAGEAVQEELENATN